MAGDSNGPRSSTRRPLSASVHRSASSPRRHNTRPRSDCPAQAAPAPAGPLRKCRSRPACRRSSPPGPDSRIRRRAHPTTQPSPPAPWPHRPIPTAPARYRRGIAGCDMAHGTRGWGLGYWGDQLRDNSIPYRDATTQPLAPSSPAHAPRHFRRKLRSGAQRPSGDCPRCQHQARLDEVWFTPTAIQPLKHARPACDDMRTDWKCCGSQSAMKPSWRVCTIEIDRGGFSYTVDTLRQIHDELPDADLFFLIGADALHDVPNGRNRQKSSASRHRSSSARAAGPELDLSGLAAICPARPFAATHRHARHARQQHGNPATHHRRRVGRRNAASSPSQVTSQRKSAIAATDLRAHDATRDAIRAGLAKL